MIDYENLRAVNQPFFDELRESFGRTLESGWYVLGSNVAGFEKSFAEYCGVAHCAGVASGLDALTLAIKALDIPVGSEILVPANTYIATILAIVNAGCVPVLVEPDIHTYNINTKLLESCITSRTSAVLVVHLYGKACQMDVIADICKKNNLRLIEDCAQSHGAKFKNKMTGSFGDASGFSFYPTKNLGALGDGGAVVTNISSVHDKVRNLRNYGSNRKYYNSSIGYNSRLDEVQAGFLSIKLKKLDGLNSHKRHLASLYRQNLKEDFVLPESNEDFEDVYHIFAVRHECRDALKDYLLKNGIKTEIHYPVPPYRQEAYRELFKDSDYPVSDEIHSTIISFPLSFSHSDEDIFRVIDVANKF